MRAKSPAHIIRTLDPWSLGGIIVDLSSFSSFVEENKMIDDY